MPGYFYIVADKSGKEKRGKIEAANKESAKEFLKKDGYVILSLEEQSRQLDVAVSFGKKLSPRDLSVFCRQFVSILEAGVAMKEALVMLEEQTENKKLKKSIAQVLTSIEKGNTLADAMRGEGDIFPSMLISMVEAGESAGNLEMAFSRMAEQFEKDAKLRATIRKATVYPIILVLACIGVIGVMLLYVIPIFIDMFKEIDMEMPPFTMFVMGLSEWAGTHIYLIVAVFAALFAGYKAYYRTEAGRKNIDAIKRKLPLFGQLVVKSNCSRFARTASTLLAAGVPMVYDMTGIGEETGNIEQMLHKLADYYDEEVEITTQTILAAMEPLIIVFMAVVVGSLVIASILPIAAMYEGLDTL